ncbi:hypothetical protein [Krasilnikovia sp. MM14-A1259]|uniref:hypothetical protein n=1 Tax=Krasilnikovia sp. MM14-A1259 TaxID=3373539 RepID=UPI00380FBCEA
MSNVGYATLSIIPSAKGFLRRLRTDTKAPLAAFTKEIGDAISEQAAKGLGDGLADVDSRALGRAIHEQTSASTARGIRDGAGKGADGVEAHLRNSVRRAFTDGFTRGFRGLFGLAQRQDKTLRTSLAFGVAGGLIQGAEEGFAAAKQAVTSFAADVNETLRGAGTAALSAITGLIATASGTAATGGLNLLVGALLAVAAAIPAVIAGFLALAPVVSLVGGTAGALFTVAAGGAATIGVLALASRGLSDAFSELSQTGTVSRATLDKLAPSARTFVQEIARLRKPFGQLQRFVQGKVFDGLAATVRRLARSWLVPLHTSLGDLATRINAFVRQAAAALSDKSFVANIQTAIGGFGAFIDRIGQAIGPLIRAFGELAAASVPFLDGLGNGLARIVERFSAWISQAAQTGALTTFMQQAARTLGEVWRIGELAVGIVGRLIAILFPSSKKASDGLLAGVVVVLQRIQDWLGKPENQKKIQDFIDKLAELPSKAVNEWIPQLQSLLATLTQWTARLQALGGLVGSWVARVSDAMGRVHTAVVVASGAIVAAIRLIAGPLIAAAQGFARFRAAVAQNVNAAAALVASLPSRFVGALAGLGSALFAMGAQAIAGFIQGLKTRIGALQATARSLGSIVLGTVRSALAIRSPSRKMRELGQWATKGFVAGMAGSMDEVTTTARKLGDQALTALRSQGFSAKAAASRVAALTAALAPRQAQINALAKRWDVLNGRLKTAKESLANAIKARDEFSGSIRDAIIGTGSIANIRTDNADSIIEAMQGQLAQAQQFGAVLDKLRAAGLNATTFRQLVENGPDSLSTAQALLNGGSAAISQVNAIQNALAETASTVGSHAASTLYQGGVDAARGLVRGLESQMGAIEKAMTRIARSMVRTIRKQLGIKSPSRVFARLGGFVGEGFALGVDRSSGTVTKSLDALTALPTARTVSLADALAARAPAAAGETHYHLHDSRATLAQLQALQERQAIKARAGRAR